MYITMFRRLRQHTERAVRCVPTKCDKQDTQSIGVMLMLLFLLLLSLEMAQKLTEIYFVLPFFMHAI